MSQEWKNPLRNYKIHLLIYVIYKFPPGRNMYIDDVSFQCYLFFNYRYSVLKIYMFIF